MPLTGVLKLERYNRANVNVALGMGYLDVVFPEHLVDPKIQ